LKKIILAIQGATASGKTSLAIDLAKHFDAEILSADSRQLYRELNIGVARPFEDELRQVKHHFIASHSIHDELTAAVFAKEARQFSTDYFRHRSVLVLVGGSGMYVDVFLNGLDELPRDEILMNEISEDYQQKGIDYLVNEINKLDQDALATIDATNPRRLMRVLEILKISKLPLAKSRKGELDPIGIPFKRFSIDWRRKELYAKINARVDEMIASGLENEVISLHNFAYLKPLQTVGYQEWSLLNQPGLTNMDVIEKIKQHTRNYAKRQLTWLNRYAELIRLDPYAEIPLKNQAISVVENCGMIIENLNRHDNKI